ncbi:MAG: hypothetical protein IIA40_14580 [SAR324 cluster bacterium]|nr:hypothetical protein [SAR324 cluster bacterium]
MNRLPVIPQVVVAGALAALATSLVIWILSGTGIFIVLGVPIGTPPDLAPWFLERVVRGLLYGLVFLVPLWQSAPQWQRGLLAAAVPLADLFLRRYPVGGQGWFGLGLGVMLPIAAIVIWLLWGMLAGWLLQRWGFRRRTGDDQGSASASDGQ